MNRIELKQEAKKQIHGNILILFLCGIIISFITNSGQLIEAFAQTFYYRTGGMNHWTQIGNPWILRYIPDILSIFNVDKSGAFYQGIMEGLAQNGIVRVYNPMFGFAFLAIALITPALQLGMTKIYLGLTKNIQPTIGKMFSGLHSFGKALWLNILIGLFTILWSFLFIIPGIIKSLSYSMAFYILAENSDFTAREALRESKRIMRGHKMDLFILYLSFIWWFLLGAVTFGIAFIYVTPYISAAAANFYNNIKSKSTDSEETIPTYETQAYKPEVIEPEIPEVVETPEVNEPEMFTEPELTEKKPEEQEAVKPKEPEIPETTEPETIEPETIEPPESEKETK